MWFVELWSTGLSNYICVKWLCILLFVVTSDDKLAPLTVILFYVIYMKNENDDEVIAGPYQYALVVEECRGYSYAARETLLGV